MMWYSIQWVAIINSVNVIIRGKIITMGIKDFDINDLKIGLDMIIIAIMNNHMSFNTCYCLLLIIIYIVA